MGESLDHAHTAGPALDDECVLCGLSFNQIWLDGCNRCDLMSDADIEATLQTRVYMEPDNHV